MNYFLSFLSFFSFLLLIQGNIKPNLKNNNQISRDLQGKMPPGIPQQLASFNDLRFHGLSWFYAKTLSYGSTLNLFAFGGAAFGPFTVNFVCDSSAGASLQVIVKNSNSYPITLHGFSVSGDSVAAVQLNSGESTSVKLFASASNGNLASNARGSLLTSNGYYVGIDTDGFLLSAGASGMPNSDCSLAGYVYYAHPHGGGYYTGLLSSNLDISTESSSSSSPSFLSGVIIGLVLGNMVVIISVFMIVKNRSLLMHSLGLNQLIPSSSSSFSCLPLDDQTTHETTPSQNNPIQSATPSTTL
mmetsp:Transcript_22542/g.23219  ORF Transcript_22542/g.23219 Transcript_22542/m.23219 type:complete len:300 (-) Transcript_22542:127-1026(-)